MAARRLLKTAQSSTQKSWRSAFHFSYHEDDAVRALSKYGYGKTKEEIEKNCGSLQPTDLKNALNHALDLTFQRDPSAITDKFKIEHKITIKIRVYSFFNYLMFSYLRRRSWIWRCLSSDRKRWPSINQPPRKIRKRPSI